MGAGSWASDPALLLVPLTRACPFNLRKNLKNHGKAKTLVKVKLCRIIYIQMNQQKIKRLSFDYIMVVLFVLTSGTIPWCYRLGAAVSFSIYLLVGFLFYMRQKGKVSKTYGFVIATLVFILLNYLCYQPVYGDNSTAGYIFTVIGSYLVISSFDFYKFRAILLDVLYWITAVGVCLYLLVDNGILQPTPIQFGDTIFTMMGPYVLGWGHLFERYAGIWHEPGAGMIPLMMVSWLYFDDFCKMKLTKGEWKKFLVIIIGILFTKSTGCYLNFMLLLCSVVFNMKIKSSWKPLIYTLTFAVFAVSVYFLFNSDVIQGKLFEDNASKEGRTGDISASFQMANERLLGYGIGSVEYMQLSRRLGNTADSSGFLKFAANLGWVFIFCWAVFLTRYMKKVYSPKQTICAFVAIVMLMFNECYMEYPISLIFLYSFYSYKKEIQYSFSKIRKNQIGSRN